MTQTETTTRLVEAARAGDEEAWSALVQRFVPLVYGVSRAYRLSPADQDEVVGTVWLRLVQHLDRVRDPEALPGWLSRTTRNEALHVIRLRRRTVPVDDFAERGTPPEDAPDIDDAILRAELHQALVEALATLKGRERELLGLLLVDPPLGYAEISQRLDMPVGSIGPTRQRCIAKLRSSVPLMALETMGGEVGRSEGR